MPNRHDPRIKLSIVISTLQVLGQTVLGFKVSIAQILISIGVAGALDAFLILRREHVVKWPASGLLTGNSVAFIMRASGTQHGDWWSLHGVHLFIAAAVLSVLSKHLIRIDGRHVFNPSNAGLVCVFFFSGLSRTFPQYLWWGTLRWPVIAALAVITAGVIWIVRPIGMLPMVFAYLATFAGIIGALAATHRSFYAIWHHGSIEGVAYFVHIVASPELFIFVFFMLTDPQTVPRAPAGRLVFAVSTAAVSGALIAPQTTEFGVKLGILAGLTITTGLAPFVRRGETRIRLARAVTSAGIIAAALSVVGVSAAMVGTAANTALVPIEQGVSGPRQ